MVRAGYKQTEVGVIPEDWECSPLEELATMKSGQSITSASISESAVYPCFGGNGLRGFTNQKTHSGSFPLIGRQGAHCGNIQFAEGDFFASEHAIVVSPKQNNDPKWLAYNLQTKDFNRLSESSAQPGLSVNKLKPLPFSHPPTTIEQKAIAGALSDVDGLIAGLEALIAKKRALKTATMQQLLTGKTRLPGFGEGVGMKQTEIGEVPEDWEVEKIGELLSITTGSKNTQDKIDDGSFPFFVRSQQVERINTYSFDGEGVLTAGDGVGTGKIFHYVNGMFDYHQRVYLMHSFGKRIDGRFFYLCFGRFFYDRIMSMTAKSSVDSVRREMISKMKISLPSMEEQRAIGRVLFDIDESISKSIQRLAKTKAIKQGMMQELLTGKTRLI